MQPRAYGILCAEWLQNKEVKSLKKTEIHASLTLQNYSFARRSSTCAESVNHLCSLRRSCCSLFCNPHLHRIAFPSKPPSFASKRANFAVPLSSLATTTAIQLTNPQMERRAFSNYTTATAWIAQSDNVLCDWL